MKNNLAYLDGDQLLHMALQEITRHEMVDGDSVLEFNDIRKAKAAWADIPYSPIRTIKVTRPFYYYRDMLDSRIERILERTKPTSYEIAYAPDKPAQYEINERYRIARRKPYKYSRQPKPQLFSELKKYMKENYVCTEITKGETDDYLGYCKKDGNIIVTVDKDALQVPGNYYDPNSDTFTTVTDPGNIYIDDSLKSKPLRGSGFIWFCAQCITGDSGDDIPGIPRIRKAEVVERLGVCESEEQAWEVVLQTYKNKDRPLHELEETAKLVWIPRNEDEFYEPTLKGERLFK